eukprot:scaffold2140_cov394-Prasinococcus_capsulatus_cf.AAC.21
MLTVSVDKAATHLALQSAFSASCLEVSAVPRRASNRPSASPIATASQDRPMLKKKNCLTYSSRHACTRQSYSKSTPRCDASVLRLMCRAATPLPSRSFLRSAACSSRLGASSAMLQALNSWTAFLHGHVCGRTQAASATRTRTASPVNGEAALGCAFVPTRAASLTMPYIRNLHAPPPHAAVQGYGGQE